MLYRYKGGFRWIGHALPVYRVGPSAGRGQVPLDSSLPPMEELTFQAG